MMPYNAEISRSNPSSIVFLLDQSKSMDEEFITNDGKKTKAEGVADVINRSLQALVAKCTKSSGIYDYLYVAAIGYSGQGVKSAFGNEGPFANKEIVPISLIGNYPSRVDRRIKRVPDGKGGFLEKKINVPVWVEPAHTGVTPMCEAFRMTQGILTRFLAQYPNCFPPIVINVTDGEASDGDPQIVGRQLMDLKSSDGNVLLFNLHISSSKTKPVQFPDNPDSLPDDYAKELFNISSHLTSYMVKVISDEGGNVTSNSRGFSFNADFNSLLKFMEIGTRPRDLGSTRDELNQLFS